MSKLLILGVLLLHGCAAIMPIASTTGAVRTEVRINELEKRIEENTKILDFLLDLNKEIQ
mgnify:CR=1 FL=1|jgi:hypothetical protein